MPDLSTREVHCQGSVVYRFTVREGPPSHGGPLARNDVGTQYDKCMGCGHVLRTLPPDHEQEKTP